VPPDAAPASLPDAAPDGPLAAAPVAPAEEKWTYVQLVTEADHLLESGATERARLLYKRAQAVKPAGPEALSGLGYVALDRGKTGLALALFKRALTTNGSFGPALFGLAETQRTLGQDDRALENYRRYVNADPSGEDVQAARRHIRLLGEAAQARPAATPP
jgi:tetratricopeptide (TPR) repeat protein